MNARASFGVNSSILVIVTTKKEIIRTPQKQIIVPTILPKLVFGKSSPYPADVKVIIMFHMALTKLLKFYPDTSVNMDSNNLR